ncbi:estrogen sulfotransferase-like [Acanthaster planci]|uniref:Estrogen sulfotransferase-like n=1 Tax=Acanthaster planci TaxID=133434 RepID=A0A8B7Z7H9_ACAPL|nr:estrogen sulfotransferase-like [Acanthaster planci]XP_022099261.1 estrogen sulfotransferase-like [Acanthaster planci]
MDKYLTFEAYKKIWSQPVKSVSVEYDGIKLHEGGDEVVKALKTFEVRDEDSWVVTFPKAGTTWVQEIMSCVMHDGDLEAVNKRHTVFRVPFLEMSPPSSVLQGKTVPKTHKIVDSIPSPRVIKSHLPGQFLPPQLWEKKAKIVYVIRNPKDVVVSYFYFTKMVDPEQKEQSFGEFFDDMMNGKVEYGPWWDHYLFFWKKRHDPKILLVRFEHLKRDLRGSVEKISKFLGKDFSAATLDAITEHCTFANMKKNPMSNPDSIWVPAEAATSFMRKGKVGDWKSHFTVAQNEAMDAFIRDRFYGTGLAFDY